MGWTVGYTLWCDLPDCYCWRQGGKNAGKAVVWAAARNLGWTRRRGKMYCPWHAANQQTQEP